MQKDIFVFTGYAQIKIRIEDSADIKYILNGKFNSLVDAIFYQTQYFTNFPPRRRSAIQLKTFI